MAITRYAGDRFTIGAGETKPTGVLDGAVLIDTGNLELYVKRDGVWVEITGAGTDALPGAPLNSVQFNNAGSFGGDADLTFTDGNRLNVNKLGISGNIYDSNNSIGDNGMVLTNEGATGVNWKAIEDVLSGVGGSGVANYVARWADEDTLTTGVLVDNGTNVGINVPSPNFPLEISSSSNATVRIEDTTNNSRLDLRAEDSAVLIRSTSNFPMRFDVNQTERMRIDTAGKVGIGTNNPYYRLDIGGATSSTVNTLRLHQANGGTAIRVGPGGGGNDITLLRVDGTTSNNSGTTDSSNVGFSLKYMGSRDGNLNALSIFTDNTSAASQIEAVTIIQDGYVGIGTASPASKLHVYGADPVLTIQDSESTVANASAILRIGESDTSANLNNNFALKFAGSASGGDLDISRYNNTSLAAQGVRIKHDGNVGIGTNSPQGKLDINTEVAEATHVYINGEVNQDKLLYFRHYANSEGAGNNAYVGYIGSKGVDNLLSLGHLNTSGTDVSIMHLTEAGNVGISTTVPSQKLHVQGNLRVTGAYYDSNNEAGTSNQVLTSTGSGGTDWKSLSQIGDTVTGDGTTNKITKWENGPDSDLTDSSFLSESGTTLTNTATATEFTTTNTQLRLPNYGRVAIGAASTNSVLLAAVGDNATFNNGEAVIKGENSGNRGTVGHASGSDLLRLNFSDALGMILNKDGHVGIGTDPKAKFEVDLNQTNGTLAADNYAHFGGQHNASGSVMGITLGYREANLLYRKVGIVARGIGDIHARQDLDFLVSTATGSTSVTPSDAKLTISGLTGNVGIGTTVPSQQLHLTGSIRMPNTTSTTTGIIYKDTSRFIHNYQHPTGDTAVPAGLNTFVGISAGNLSMGSTATAAAHGSYNSGFGYQALNSLTTGYSNTAVGREAGEDITTGYSNTMVGKSAGSNIIGGIRNIFIGDAAGLINTSGNYNTIVGYNGLRQNATGAANTAIGSLSLENHTASAGNTALGYQSLRYLTTGQYNIAIGYFAGLKKVATGNLTNASYGIYLGYAVDGTEGASGEIVIGKDAKGLGSNTTRLGGSNITKTVIEYGNVGIGKTDPDSPLHVYTTAEATARFQSTDNKAEIYVYDNDTTAILGAEGANIYLGSSTGSANGFLRINTNTGNANFGATPEANTRLKIVPRTVEIASNSTNYQKAVYASGLNFYDINSGVTDSGYRIAVDASVFVSDADFEGTLADQYAIWARHGANVSAAGSTITRSIGVYIDSLTNANTTITNLYGLYQEDSVAKNYFSGSVGIGTTSSGSKLHVNGGSKYFGGGDWTTIERVTTTEGNYALYVQTTGTNTNQAIAKFNYGCTAGVANTGTAVAAIAREKSYFLSKLGIGTASPYHELEVSGSGDATIRITSTSTSIGDDTRIGTLQYFSSDTNSNTVVGEIVSRTPVGNFGNVFDMAFSTYKVNSGALSEKMRITGGGNVGIGITDPQAQLHINGGDLDTRAYQQNSSTNSIYLNPTNGNATGTSNTVGGGVIWKTWYNNYTKKSAGILAIGEGNYFRSGLAFYTNNNANQTTDWSERMRIAMDGNVGIGTTSADLKLHINNAGGSPNTRFSRGTGYIFDLKIDNIITDSAIDYIIEPNQASSGILFRTHNSSNTNINALAINRDGNVGIGTLNPLQKLHVVGSTLISNNNYHYGYTSGGAQAALVGIKSNNYVTIGQLNANNVGTDIYGGTGNIYLYSGSTNRLTVSSDVNVQGATDLNINGPSRRLNFTSGTGTVRTTTSNNLILQTNSISAITIYPTQQVQFNAYGSGTFTGTATQRLAVDSSGNVIEVPIGSGAVDGSGAANKVTYWTDTDTISYNNNFHWDNTNGNLGVGTATPAATVQIVDSTSGASVLKVDGTNGTLFEVVDDLSGSLMSVNDAAGLPVFEVFADNHIVAGRYNQNDFYLNTSGNLGLGTSSPITKLNIKGDQSADGQLYIEPTNDGEYAGLVIKTTRGADRAYAIFAGGTGTDDLNFRFRDASAGADRMVIDSSGKVGIGTDDPKTKLHIDTGSLIGAIDSAYSLAIRGDGIDGIQILSDSAYSGRIVFGDQNSNNAGRIYYDHSTDAFRFFTNGTEKVSILSGGNVGIGTTNPSTDFSVKEHLLFNDTTRLLTISNNTNTGGINLDGGNSRLYFSGYRALEGNSSGTTLIVGEGYGTTRISSVLNVVDHETILSPDQGSSGGVTSRALTIENINDSNWTADALTAYNATTGYDIRDRASLSFFARPTQGSILTYASETANQGTLHRFVNLNSSATEPLYRWDFYQYDGSGTGNDNFKVPDKLFQIRVREGASEVEKFTIKGNGKVGIGINNPSNPLHVESGDNVLATFESTDANATLYLKDSNTTASSTFKRITNDLAILESGGNVGIGTVIPGGKLHVYGGTTAFTNLSDNTDSVQITRNTSVHSHPDAKLFIYDNSNSDYAQKIDLAGNSYGLRIEGFVDYGLEVHHQTLGLVLAARSSGLVINENGGDYNFRVEGDTDQNLLFVDAGTDSVGIGGSPNSSYKLDVSGDTLIQESESGDLKLVVNNVSTLTLARSAVSLINNTGSSAGLTLPSTNYTGVTGWANRLILNTDSNISNGILVRPSTGGFTVSANGLANTNLRVDTNGRVGVNTASPSYDLDVIGDISSNGQAIASYRRLRSYDDFATSTNNTAGWYPLFNWGTTTGDRGGYRVYISYTGGNWAPNTTVLKVFKNWSGDATITIEKYGGTLYLPEVRVIGDASSATVYTLEVYLNALSQGHNFSVYYEALGYDETGASNVNWANSSLALSTNTGSVIASAKVSSEGIATSNLNISNDIYLGDQIIHMDDSNTFFQFPANDTMRLVANSHQRFNIETTETVVNEDGHDYNFRVEGDNDQNLLFVDAGTDRVGIGTPTPSYTLHTQGTIYASSRIGVQAVNTSYLATLGGSSDAKLLLTGSSSPYIRFQESTTNRAYIQWLSTTDSLKFQNQQGDYFDFSTHDEGSIGLRLMGFSGALWGYVYATASSGGGKNIGLLDGGGSWAIRHIENTKTEWRIDNDIKMTLLGSGNLGIGVTDPDALLEVKNSDRFQLKVSGWSPDGAGASAGAIQIGDTDAHCGRIYVDNTNTKLHITNTYNSGNGDIVFLTKTAGTTIDAVTIKGSGNVGIGTTLPSQKLHVQGTLRLTGAFYDSNNVAGTSGQVLTSTGSATDWKDLDEISGVTASNPTTTNYVTKWSNGTNEVITDSLIYDNGTNVGIGTATPLGKLDILRLSSAEPGLIARANRDGAKMNFAYTNSNSMGEIGTTYYNSTGAMRLWIGGNLNSNSTGHVGPTQQGTSSSSWFSEYNTSNDYYQINRIAAGGGTSSSTLFYITSAGNVGIGGVTPTLGKLQVAGRGYFGPVGTGDATTKALMDTYSVLKLKPHNTNSTNMTFAQVNGGAGIGIQVTNGTQTANWDIALNPYGGSVGIGTPSPEEKLHVNGNVRGDSFGSEQNTTSRIFSPAGATYNGSSSQTGYLIVELPDNGATGVNNMMSGVIRVFDYTTHESFDVHFAGYWYSGYNWVNQTAWIENSPQADRNFKVRFGKSTGTSGSEDRPFITIGESNSTWSYVKFSVVTYTAGHSNVNLENWNSGWATSLSASLPGTVLRTVSNTQANNWTRNDDKVYYNNGNVGIGTTNPGAKLHVSAGAIIGDSAQQATTLTIRATNTAGSPAATAKILMEGYEGRGIGTFYTDSTYSGEEWFCGMNYSGNFNSWNIGYDQAGGQAEYLANTLFQLHHNGKLQLHAYGAGTFTGTATQRLAVDASGNVIEIAGGIIDGSGTEDYVARWTDTDTLGIGKIRDDNSTVAINTAPDSSYMLKVAGNGYFSGTLTEASSLAIKENIENFTPSIDKINKIRPVKYNKKGSDKKEIGLIAEELEELFPELVEKDENGNPSGVNYSRAVTVLLGGFKELYKELQEIKKRI